MNNTEFERYFALYNNDIKAIARKLARRDNDLYEDLYQEGCITLWKLNAAKARENIGSWIRSAVRNRMIDFLRRQRFYDTESLDALIAVGNQIVMDLDTQESSLLRLGLPKQTSDDYYEDQVSNDNTE